MAEVTIFVAAREVFLCREEFCFTSEQSQGGAQEVPVTVRTNKLTKSTSSLCAYSYLKSSEQRAQEIDLVFTFCKTRSSRNAC